MRNITLLLFAFFIAATCSSQRTDTTVTVHKNILGKWILSSDSNTTFYFKKDSLYIMEVGQKPSKYIFGLNDNSVLVNDTMRLGYVRLSFYNNKAEEEGHYFDVIRLYSNDLVLMEVINDTIIPFILFRNTYRSQEDLPINGFENKAEASNQRVNDLKERTWTEYLDASYNIVKDKSTAMYYRLIVYSAGKPYGITRLYDINGNLKKMTLAMNGEVFPIENRSLDKITGSVKSYYKSGKLKRITPYTDGKFNGLVKQYYENGTLQEEMPYSNGKITGVDKQYFENGILEKENPYTEDILNGTEKGYYKSGKLHYELPYSNGTAGKQITYDETGKVISKN